MDIISYRGPGAAGGVSSGLESGWKNQKHDARWWFIAEDSLKYLRPNDSDASFVMHIPEPVIKGHYAYCNQLIWPLMHDLPEYASYDADNRRLYKKFNNMFAQHISFEQGAKAKYFVQDYQLALLPRLMTMQGERSTIFWHIPWPKQVAEEFVEPIMEIASGLLAAESVGFHTNEYAQNFMDFVQNYMGEFSINRSEMLIYKTKNASRETDQKLVSGLESSSYILRPYLKAVSEQSNATKLIVQPLGIDVDKWVEQSSSGKIDLGQIGLHAGDKFILSVDRADYTKAVFHRIKIIDRFFEINPHLKGTFSFVQICGRSRVGVPVFDKYWEDCRELARTVNERWSEKDWRPLNWVEKPLSGSELAALYPLAEAMLVNPVRDGLNLTAKEFIACRHSRPGALLLSPGAGAWHELGQHALPADPLQYEQTADSILRALHMESEEVRARTMMLRHKVERNPLSLWWKHFVKAASQVPKAHVPESQVKSA